MSEQLLTILKLCLLALLYLFFLRVLRAVWAEIKGPKPVEPPPERARQGQPLGSARKAAGAQLAVVSSRPTSGPHVPAR